MLLYFVCDFIWLGDGLFIVLGQDKWRNMSVMANGWGSREKSRLAVKRTFSLPKQEENSLALTNSLQSDEENVDATSGLQVSSNPPPRRPNVRLEMCLFCFLYWRGVALLYLSRWYFWSWITSQNVWFAVTFYSVQVDKCWITFMWYGFVFTPLFKLSSLA